MASYTQPWINFFVDEYRVSEYAAPFSSEKELEDEDEDR